MKEMDRRSFLKAAAVFLAGIVTASYKGVLPSLPSSGKPGAAKEAKYYKASKHLAG